GGDPMMGSMMRRAMLGDGSTLSLDFTQMSTLADLTSRGLTFSRSTSGTFINANGLVATATAGNPRFEYDPSTLQPRGLLIEGSAVNLALRSDDFNTTVTDGTQWSSSGYTAGTLSTTLPDGTTGNARRLSIASGAGSFRSAAITVLASTAYTFSFWARNNGGSQARYRVWNVSAGSSIVDYTLSGSNYVSQIGGANNTSSTWVRVSVSFTTPVGCTSIYVYPCSSDSGTVDLLVWGAQVETGSGASSYIPTVASTGSRSADSCVMTGTNFSSWYNATEGTLLAHAIRSRTNDIGRIVSLNDNTANESIDVAADTTGEFIVRDGGSALATISPGTVTANTAFKIAGAFKLNDVQAALGGTLGTADTSVTMPTVNRLMIGQQAGASPVYLNGTIALLKYWPTRLPNAQLQALTT
ncbi:MAG: carbohydrate binding domain-containing protein, partial [Alphaproteobacteria bacterium]